jgi:hypothetical protein
MDFHVYHHHVYPRRLEQKLDEILHRLEKVQRKEDHVTVELDALTAQVAANTELEASAILLIQGIADQLAAVKDDPAAIAALAANLKVSADSLAAAITANTPPV